MTSNFLILLPPILDHSLYFMLDMNPGLLTCILLPKLCSQPFLETEFYYLETHSVVLAGLELEPVAILLCLPSK